MPKIIVSIEWLDPNYAEWLAPDNIKMCLEKECINTEFDVIVLQIEEGETAAQIHVIPGLHVK